MYSTSYSSVSDPIDWTSISAVGPTAQDRRIGGKRVPAVSGRYFDTLDPSTEQVIARVAEADAADIDLAVRSARQAFEGEWGQMRPSERGQALLRWADLIRRHAEELVELESLNSGKPVASIRRQDLPAVLDTLTYYAGWADKINGQVIPTRPDALTYTVREAVGVVGAIVPWNFPLMMAAWKVAPALACANTVVLKPAEQTPLSALELAAIGQEAGLPAGVLNVVTGFGEPAGAALVRHADVDKIAFTGSTAVGRTIMREAAETLKKVSLELGGKSPNIVFEDADLDAAVRGATLGIFYGNGEVCAAGSRLLVDRAIKDEFIDKLAARTGKMRPGDPLDPKTRLGAISSRGQLDRVLGYIETGSREGGALVAGGKRADIGTGKGYFVEPTVFANVTPDMTIAREEIFGPVLAVIDFADEEEAIARANQSDYGLAAAVWTRDIKKAHRVARRVQAGTVWVNTYNVYDSAAP